MAGYNLDNDLNGQTLKPLIREIGQRIGNLLKFVCFFIFVKLLKLNLLTKGEKQDYKLF